MKFVGSFAFLLLIVWVRQSDEANSSSSMAAAAYSLPLSFLTTASPSNSSIKSCRDWVAFSKPNNTAVCLSEDGCTKQLECSQGKYVTDDCNCSAKQVMTCIDYPTEVLGCLDREVSRVTDLYCGLDADEPPKQCGTSKQTIKLPSVRIGGKWFVVGKLNIRRSFIIQEASLICSGSLFTGVLPEGFTMAEGNFDMNKFCIPYTRMSVLVWVRGTCQQAIECYRFDEHFYYTIEPSVVLRKLKTTCTSCWANCNNGEVKVMANFEGPKRIKLCKPSECLVRIITENEFTHVLSLNDRIVGGRVDIEVSDDKGDIVSTFGTECKAEDVCEAINCSFCWEALRNPKCVSSWLWAVMGIMGFSTLIFTALAIWALSKFMLLIPFARWILAAIKFPFLLCWRPISSAMEKRRERRAVDEVPLRDNPRGSVSRTALEMMRAMEKGIMIFSLISHALAGPSEFALPTSKMGCSNVQTLTIPSGHCSENGNGSYQCYSDKINTVDMFPGLPGCFQVSAEGKLSTFALLTLKSVKLVCSKQSLYFTADTEVEVHSNHRCSGSGQCYYGIEACSNFKSTDNIVDLPDDINEAVGDSGCIPAPGCASNGCFYCTQSCLFYKTVWKRKSNPVEVFRCSEWTEKFTIDVKFDNSDVVQTVELIRSEVTKVGNFTMWFDKGFDIVAPILSDKFIRMGKSTLISPASEQGMPVSGQIGDLQCPSEISAVEMRSGSCRKSQSRCSCSATGSAALCSCQNSKLTAVLETKKKLPITLANGILQMSSGSVELEAKDRRPFTINIRVPNGGVIPYYREVSCTGSLLSFKGCYQCLTGAILKYTCHSSGGSVVTVADCGAFKIPISCGSDPTVIREVRVEPQSQEINVECKVMCQKGGFSFQMKAFLDYAGLPKFGTEGNVGEPSKGWSISMPQFGLIAIYSYYVLFLVLAALFGAFYILRRVLKKKEG